MAVGGCRSICARNKRGNPRPACTEVPETGVGRDAIRIKHPGCKEGILGLPVPRSPKLGCTRVIAGRVPEFAMGAKKNCQKAQSPGIRGFGVFDVQDFFNEVEVSGVRYVPDAGSWCIEAVHGRQTLCRSKCGRGLAPDCGGSVM